MTATAETFASWLAEQGRATNTVGAYRRDVAAYLRWLSVRGRAVADVDEALVGEYIGHLGDSRRSSSVARAVVALRAFHRWCSAAGWCAHDPSTAVDAPVVQRAGRATVDESDVARVLAVTTGQGFEARRDRALVLVLYRCGVKATEAIALDVGDVDVRRHRLRVDREGARPRTVPLVPDVEAALAEWLGPLGRGRLDAGGSALFLNQRGQRLTRQGLWLLCRTAGARAGLGGVLAPNDLRHACGHELALRGIESAQVASLLGHSGGAAPSREQLTEVGWGGE